jgi:hypothetical protein
MARKLVISGVVVALLVLAIVPCAEAGTTVIHVDTEEGGPIFDGANGTLVNEKGAIFWNGASWITNPTAAHTYFTYVYDNSIRLMNYTTDVTYVGGETGTVRTGTMNVSSEIVSYSITVSRYQYQLDINGSTWTADAYQYDISSSGWKVILQSRSDGVVNGSSYFHAFISQSPENTLVLREGVDVTRRSVGIDQALNESPGQIVDYKVGGGDNNSYWLDLQGGSDMGGLTYQLITAKYDMNGTVEKNAIAMFMLDFMNEGALHKIAFQPSVHLTSSIEGNDSGMRGASPFDDSVMAIAFIAILTLAISFILALLLVRRKKKDKGE